MFPFSVTKRRGQGLDCSARAPRVSSASFGPSHAESGRTDAATRLWALRSVDSLKERHVTHVLSLFAFNPTVLKNFNDEPWSHYGRQFKHLVVDIDDVDEADLLAELPRAVRFIDSALRPEKAASSGGDSTPADSEEQAASTAPARRPPACTGGVFVHCAAGKSRSAAVVIAYLLWRYPERFTPGGRVSVASSLPVSRAASESSRRRSRKETAEQAVDAALRHVRLTRAMAEPNSGFMEQLRLWWTMDCPDNVAAHPIYQRWVYRREVELHVAAGQAPGRLRLEDEESPAAGDEAGSRLRCKKCRRTLATAPFIVDHEANAPSLTSSPCAHFIEPLSWMREELTKGNLNGRLLCPNPRCRAVVGRYDWRGFRCACTGWVTPAFSLQRGRVDEVGKGEVETGGMGQNGAQGGQGVSIRMPPGTGGSRGGNL